MSEAPWFISTVWVTEDPEHVHLPARIVLRLRALDAEDYRVRVRDQFPEATVIEFGPVSLSKVQR